uniref:Uncharacterized protein LOC117356917 n=1 Tax=Geotrypetes seraphini TaxID=260995 RepID=A0A6P8QAL7_GEOSA|nr:uncharacterized protein LOC117356917 [Geotrypetes seraphini]
MDGGESPQPQEKWSEAEIHVLLDLIKDLGLVGLLSRKRFQNWDVFERLHVLLKRCNILFSPGQIKARWKKLKLKYLRLKRFIEMGGSPGLLADFPYYQELEQLLGAAIQDPGLCRREADSSGLSSTAGVEQRTLDAAVALDLEASMQQDDAEFGLEEEAGGFSMPPNPEENDGIVLGLLEDNPVGQENLDQSNPSQSAGAVCDPLHESWTVLSQELQPVLQVTVATLDRLVQTCKEISTEVESLSSQIVRIKDMLATALLSPTSAGASTPEAPPPEVPAGPGALSQDPAQSRNPRSGPSSVYPAPRRSMRQRRPSVRYLHY